MYRPILVASVLLGALPGLTQAEGVRPLLLKPARVFDGVTPTPHQGWVVLVRGERIEAAGPASDVKAPPDARVIELPDATVLPGLIDAHTHVLLHPYNETPWDDQVLKEPLALRVCRATNHLRSILRSGFTTIRDLGTEGAGYADVGLKQAVEQGIIPGPRMIVVTRAIVATGSYGPKGFAPEIRVPQGAEEADGATLPARGPRPDRPRSRLDQGLCRLLEPCEGRQAHLLRGGVESRSSRPPARRVVPWPPMP